MCGFSREYSKHVSMYLQSDSTQDLPGHLRPDLENEASAASGVRLVFATYHPRIGCCSSRRKRCGSCLSAIAATPTAPVKQDPKKAVAGLAGTKKWQQKELKVCLRSKPSNMDPIQSHLALRIRYPQIRWWIIMLPWENLHLWGQSPIFSIATYPGEASCMSFQKASSWIASDFFSISMSWLDVTNFTKRSKWSPPNSVKCSTTKRTCNFGNGVETAPLRILKLVLYVLNKADVLNQSNVLQVRKSCSPASSIHSSSQTSKLI